MKKLLSLVLALAMLLSMATILPAAAESTLEPAHITLYFVSDEPRNMQAVEDKLNEMFKRDLNTTIEVNFTTWTNYSQKYDMELMAGDSVDLIYAANWLSYSNYANKGAFMELDELLPKYAPELYKAISDSTWNQVSVGGHLYGIPCIYDLYHGKGIMYRQDLCNKYNLPVPSSIETVEQYLLGVKENDPEMKLYEVSVDSSSGYFGPMTLLLNFRYGMVNEDGPAYGLVAEYKNPDKLISYWDTPEFIEDLKTLKRWNELGFWSRSVLSGNIDPAGYDDGFYAMATAGLNTAKCGGARSQLLKIDPTYDSQVYLFANIHGKAWSATPMSDLTCIPYGSKNPERALMVLEKLMLDKDYYRLMQYGIYGEDYTLDENDVYTMTVDADGTATYGCNPFPWSERNGNLDPVFSGEDSAWGDAEYAKLKAFRANTPFGGADIAGSFLENPDMYQAEKAAMANVYAQYLAPLMAGMVDDVEAGVAEFLEKAEQAGLRTIQEEYTKQWTAYCQEHNYIGQ